MTRYKYHYPSPSWRYPWVIVAEWQSFQMLRVVLQSELQLQRLLEGPQKAGSEPHEFRKP
jgi:hypothetical protein